MRFELMGVSCSVFFCCGKWHLTGKCCATYCLSSELSPNNGITVVDGNTHKCSFLKIRLNLRYILRETQLLSLSVPDRIQIHAAHSCRSFSLLSSAHRPVSQCDACTCRFMIVSWVLNLSYVLVLTEMCLKHLVLKTGSSRNKLWTQHWNICYQWTWYSELVSKHFPILNRYRATLAFI